MKTISLKKVAVVAVASLGFGLLSVVPANAAVGTALGISVANTTTDDGAALSATKYTSNPIRDPLQISAFEVVASSAVVLHLTAVGGTFTADDRTKVDLRSATANFGTVVASHANAATADGAEDPLPSFNAPAVAGTYFLDVFTQSTTDAGAAIGAADELKTTVTMVVVAAAGLSAGTSTALIIGGNTATAASPTTDATAIAASRSMAAANVANIQVSAKDTANSAYTSVTLSASIVGPGYLSWVTADDATPVANSCSTTPTYSGTVGRSISSQTADALGVLYICADGVAGTSTVTVTLKDTVSGVSTQIGSTKTITFYGSVTKLELAKSVWTNIRSGGEWQDGTDADTQAELRALTATKTQSVTIKMTDSAGRVANSGSEPTVVSGDTAVIAQGLCGLDDGADSTYSSGGTGYYNCGFQSASSAKSGDKATVTIRIVDPADATKYLTVTANLTIGGAVASEVITTDKTSYAPGENMVLTITAKDSAGNPAYDGAATPSAVVASKSAIGLPSAASFYVAGKKSWGSTGGVYAPALGGTFALTATGTDAAATKLTASASVIDANAGLLTQIDALNAKIVALNALIAKIMKKLGVK